VVELKRKIPPTVPEGENSTDKLKRPLLVSAVGHAILLVASLWGALSVHRGELWGENSGGSATSLRLVASVPLPPPTISTTNRVANEEPGLHYPEPAQPKAKPAPKPEPEKAIELPDRRQKQTPKRPPAPPPQREAFLHDPMRNLPQTNEIPYGAGGPAQGPFGGFQTNSGVGGFQFSGSAGDFGTRYGWYVTAMRNKISSNWLQGTVDPNIRVAPRVYVTFQILRDGQIVNTQLIASSGILSLDQSALRAIADSNPLPSLPNDYRGSNVAVEFWFDLRR